jgi:hypothetical protein
MDPGYLWVETQRTGAKKLNFSFCGQCCDSSTGILANQFGEILGDFNKNTAILCIQTFIILLFLAFFAMVHKYGRNRWKYVVFIKLTPAFTNLYLLTYGIPILWDTNTEKML